jgi:hypothetical protein
VSVVQAHDLVLVGSVSELQGARRAQPLRLINKATGNLYHLGPREYGRCAAMRLMVKGLPVQISTSTVQASALLQRLIEGEAEGDVPKELDPVPLVMWLQIADPPRLDLVEALRLVKVCRFASCAGGSLSGLVSI